MQRRVPITEAQRELSYAKYYDEEIVTPPQESLALIQKGPIDPAEALPISERNRLFEPGYLEAEIGFCIMPDGTGYVANLTRMPGVTAEMFDWWFAWHGLGELRYTIWDPEDNYSARSLNPAVGRCDKLSLKERYWNTTHLIREDIGGGVEELCASFRQPKDLGFDEDKIGTPACGTIVAALAGPTDGSGSEVMCHFVRETEGGVELRTRFWMGWTIVNGREVKTLSDGVKILEEAARMLLMHNVKEFHQLAHILPRIYAEQKDNWNEGAAFIKKAAIEK